MLNNPDNTQRHDDAVSEQLAAPGETASPVQPTATHACTTSQPGRRIAAEVFSLAWPVMLSYVAVGMPCGVLAAKAGMDPLMNFVLGLTFLTGSGQFMMSNLLLAGIPIGSVVASVCAISTRFSLYSASLAPYLQHFGKPQALAISCTYSEEAYGISLGKLAHGGNWTWRHALLLNLTVQFTWAISCTLGAALGSVVDIPTAIAGFAMTSLFVYLLCTQSRTVGNACAMAGAAATVFICKCVGLTGVAVPLGALVGMGAGMASALLPHDDKKATNSSDASSSANATGSSNVATSGHATGSDDVATSDNATRADEATVAGNASASDGAATLGNAAGSDSATTSGNFDCDVSAPKGGDAQ
ncbi:MAG: AzlC family ABC transporter permease [Atopobiaceae bacterium]